MNSITKSNYNPFIHDKYKDRFEAAVDAQLAVEKAEQKPEDQLGFGEVLGLKINAFIKKTIFEWTESTSFDKAVVNMSEIIATDLTTSATTDQARRIKSLPQLHTAYLLLDKLSQLHLENPNDDAKISNFLHGADTNAIQCVKQFSKANSPNEATARTTTIKIETIQGKTAEHRAIAEQCALLLQILGGKEIPKQNFLRNNWIGHKNFITNLFLSAVGGTSPKLIEYNQILSKAGHGGFKSLDELKNGAKRAEALLKEMLEEVEETLSIVKKGALGDFIPMNVDLGGEESHNQVKTLSSNTEPVLGDIKRNADGTYMEYCQVKPTQILVNEDDKTAAIEFATYEWKSITAEKARASFNIGTTQQVDIEKNTIARAQPKTHNFDRMAHNLKSAISLVQQFQDKAIPAAEARVKIMTTADVSATAQATPMVEVQKPDKVVKGLLTPITNVQSGDIVKVFKDGYSVYQELTEANSQILEYPMIYNKALENGYIRNISEKEAKAKMFRDGIQHELMMSEYFRIVPPQSKTVASSDKKVGFAELPLKQSLDRLKSVDAFKKPLSNVSLNSTPRQILGGIGQILTLANSDEEIKTTIEDNIDDLDTLLDAVKDQMDKRSKSEVKESEKALFDKYARGLAQYHELK